MKLSVLALLLTVCMVSCHITRHSTFTKRYIGTNKNGSSYTMWVIPDEFKNKEVATVEVWILNIQNRKTEKYKRFYAIQGKDSTEFQEKKQGQYYFELTPGKYSFLAHLDFIVKDQISTRRFNFKKGSYYYMIMLYAEDLSKEGRKVIDQDSRKVRDKVLKEALENMEKEKQEKGNGNK